MAGTPVASPSTRPIGAVPVALCVIAALSPIAVFGVTHLLFPRWWTGPTATAVLREVVLLALSGGVLLYALRIERVDPASLGLRRPRLSSLGWGVGGALTMFVVDAAVIAGLAVLHVRQDGRMLAELTHYPVPMLLLIAFTAAVSEEILFRAVLIDHLARLAHNRWVGAIGAVLAFSLAHLGGWDATQLLFVLPSGVVLTLLFLWKRDMTACVIAHFVVDAVGLVAASASHLG